MTLPHQAVAGPDGSIAVGVITNPSSGRDVRRLLGWASVFPVSEKINVVLRLLSALGSLGVGQAWMPPDAAGIASRVREAADLARGRRPMPHVRLLQMPVHDTARDSAHAAAALAGMGVGMIAVLGGDGTHRVVAAHCGEVPLATLSTGTNNAFPHLREATLVGLAAGLVITGRVAPAIGIRRNKRLRIAGAGLDEIALVDVGVSRELARGAGAISDGEHLGEIFVAFAQPGQIGLSSIAGLSNPVSRDDPFGLHLRLGPGRTLHAPLLPGMLKPVSIASARRLLPRQPVPVEAARGTLAIDGERLVEFDAGHRLEVQLELEGPRTLAVEPVLAQAARCGLLFDTPGPFALD